MGLVPAARISRRTCPGPGGPTFSSPTASTSGPPNAVATTLATMFVSNRRRWGDIPAPRVRLVTDAGPAPSPAKGRGSGTGSGPEGGAELGPEGGDIAG